MYARQNAKNMSIYLRYIVKQKMPNEMSNRKSEHWQNICPIECQTKHQIEQQNVARLNVSLWAFLSDFSPSYSGHLWFEVFMCRCDGGLKQCAEN